jgi:hypothetical protein
MTIEKNEPIILPTPTYHINQALHHLEQAGVEARNLREAALFFAKELDGVDVHKLWPIAEMKQEADDDTVH